MSFVGVPEGNRTLVTAATERRSAIELRAPRRRTLFRLFVFGNPDLAKKYSTQNCEELPNNACCVR